jgi:hypothetical protein
MKTQKVKISQVKRNPENPRLIKDNKFHKLVKSIKEFPEMLEIRPIVVNDDMVVLGGNMRLKACQEAGLKEVHIIKADKLTVKKQREFIVKDNVGFGEWDWDMLANEWDINELDDWGLDLPFDTEPEESENTYSKKIEAPSYEPSEEKPTLKDLFNDEKTNQLIGKIDSSTLLKHEKDFLKLAATRHLVFDYKKIADFYAHSNKEVQELMEESALIIIDFKKAIEQGYVQLSEKITEQYINEYGE